MQWAVGVVPCIPGFIAAINDSVSVSSGLTELYNMNYLYGFLSSMVGYWLLHRIFPAPQLDYFVKEPEPASDVQSYFNDRWEVTLAQTSQILREDGNKQVELANIEDKQASRHLEF